MKKENEKMLQEMIDNVVNESIQDFIKPFSNISHAVTNTVTRVGTVAIGNITKVIGNIIHILIPFIDKSETDKLDKKIDNKINERMNLLNAEYDNIVLKSLDTFHRSKSLLKMGASILAMEQILHAIDVLTFGKFKTISRMNTMLKKFSHVDSNSSYNTNNNYMSSYGGSGGYDDYSGGIFENKNEFLEITRKQILRIIENPEVLKTINDNKNIKNINFQIELEKYKIVLDRINQLINVKTYEDLRSFMDSDFNQFNKNIDKLSIKLKNDKNLTDKMKQEALVDVKQLYKTIYINYINKNINNKKIKQDLLEKINKI